MPSKSQSQFKFMKAVENKDIKVPSLSPEIAKEFTSKTDSFKDLPKKARQAKYKKMIE